MSLSFAATAIIFNGSAALGKLVKLKSFIMDAEYVPKWTIPFVPMFSAL
jgi:hypothetical protein